MFVSCREHVDCMPPHVDDIPQIILIMYPAPDPGWLQYTHDPSKGNVFEKLIELNGVCMFSLCLHGYSGILA